VNSRQQRYQERNKHPCAECGAPVLKNSKRCKVCDKKWRKKEMSENPVRLRHGYSTRKNTNRVRPEYYIWNSMLQRCENPKAKQYEDYGGQGIAVCERWHLFDNFLADMGPRPDGKHSSGRAMYTLERKDGNSDYSKENCVWATYKDQSLNKRNGRMITYLGETQPLAVFVDRVGANYKIVHQRLSRGWSIEEALGGAR
jgi:hypothetical protein